MSKVVIAGLAVCAFALPALAQPTNMNLAIRQVDGPSWNWQSEQTRGTWSAGTGNQWHHTGDLNNSSFGVHWDLDLDPDPFVSNNFSLTNNTNAVQTYVITVTLPVAPPVPAPTSTFGSVSMTVLDSNGINGATLSTAGPGSSIYTALIDGVSYRTLADDPFSVFAPVGTNAAGPVNFSFAGSQPGVTTSIAITNTFTLTPGDGVGIVSFFRIDPVPAPGAVGLIAFAGMAAARRRRA